jgi:hypothetical protein
VAHLCGVDPWNDTNIPHAEILQRIFRENKARIKRVIKHLKATTDKYPAETQLNCMGDVLIKAWQTTSPLPKIARRAARRPSARTSIRLREGNWLKRDARAATSERVKAQGE